MNKVEICPVAPTNLNTEDAPPQGDAAPRLFMTTLLHLKRYRQIELRATSFA